MKVMSPIHHPCPPPALRFWFYGDDEPVKRLEILDRYLTEFQNKAVSSAVATQKLMHSPRRVTQHYAAGDAEEGEQKV